MIAEIAPSGLVLAFMILGSIIVVVGQVFTFLRWYYTETKRGTRSGY